MEQRDIEILEAQRLVGDISGTDVVAAPTLGAGVEVQPLLLSELL
jgi:hypothetical protein